jgi:hypothetical protein
MTSELGSKWYERKMEDFVGRNVRAQGPLQGQKSFYTRNRKINGVLHMSTPEARIRRG